MKKFMVRTLIKQSVISMLCFVAVLLTFAQIDWMQVFGLHHSIIEEKLGDVYWDLFSQTEEFIKQEETVAPVDSMLSMLCHANGIDRDRVQLHLVKSEEINAYACPGDHLVVYTSLLGACDRPEELCGVLAHELAHITSGHVMRKLIKEIGIATLTVLVSGNGGGEAFGEVMRVLSSTAYDRSLEREADDLAITYLLQAGVDPRPLGDFLLRISEDEKLPSFAEWISTHPDSEKRSQWIYRRAGEEGQKKSSCGQLMTQEEWNGYKQCVKEFIPSHADSQSCNVIPGFLFVP